jgi:hypothetical protein
MLRIVLFVSLVAALLYIGFREGQPMLDAYRTVDVADLMKRPHEFEGRRVTVGGTVANSAAIMGVGGYLVRQGSAEIFVLGRHGIPRAGSEVSVSGTFKQALAVNGFEYAVILQK